MAEDQPGLPGSSNQDDRPGQRPTEPLGGPAHPPAPPPSSGQPGGDQQPPGSGPRPPAAVDGRVAAQQPAPAGAEGAHRAAGPSGDARWADELVHLFIINDRSRRLVQALKADTLASQALKADTLASQALKADTLASQALPSIIGVSALVAAPRAADWPPSGEWSGRAEWCASRD
jgi:hypothetical protein